MQVALEMSDLKILLFDKNIRSGGVGGLMQVEHEEKKLFRFLNSFLSALSFLPALRGLSLSLSLSIYLYT